MRGIVVTISDEFEEPQSDIVLRIDFNEGKGSAARPFQIAADLIAALEDVDATLIKSVDSRIETAMIVEDLQKNCIKVFLRNVLRTLDDDALKTLDWKPLVGQYLVKGKYAALRFLDSKEPQIEDLTAQIADLAREVDIHHLPTPTPPNPTRLVQSLDRLQAVKRSFRDGEGLTITLDRTEYKVDLSSDWVPSETIKVPPGEKELVALQPTILVVRKPDMLGRTAWQFRLGKKNMTLPIEDMAWLDAYHGRQEYVLPGDALEVVLKTVSRFAANGELIENKVSVSKVVGVIPNAQSPQQDDLPLTGKE